ncbi:hemolysin family protein [Fictibacillus barbaricus]|uniref:CBS domain containing-hemolysin-like protein n=1 Tax=Fictibacillus barbaricus TaxID=182136 RepID=A0ABU1TXY3_9BACL|nr:hemolysin family protein [Fictibacillus barbaricus]MDR7072075.1 CBS domain containing-hemolysin-like protein [Fictibacillus barbaricus]
MPYINVLMIILLIILTAFFVATEFAIVKVRKTRIDHLAAEGNKNAIAAKQVIENLDGYLSACQLGITITALGLGWLGEPTVQAFLDPLFKKAGLSEGLTHTLSFTIAFSFITFIHVVLGELSPKTFAIQKAEAISLAIARPIITFYKVMFPFIFVLNGSANLFTKMFGVGPAGEHEAVHTEEELRLILSESLEGGEINQSEYRYVNRIFEFDDRVAKEIMIPRTEMVCLFLDNSSAENLAIMREEKFTRYPVATEDKDHIVGLVNIKEFFNEHFNNQEYDLHDYIRPIITVHEHTPIQKLLVKMQKDRTHMAVLVDEYGGTAGIVTVEDILEEIVGEIRDEFDIDEVPEIQQITPTKTIVDGKVLISEINAMFALDIDNSEIDTIGGWVLTRPIDLENESEFEYESYHFTILELDGRQVKRIQIENIKQGKTEKDS